MSSIATSSYSEADPGYDQLLAAVRARIDALTGAAFTTDAAGLWDAYLDGFPADRRQHYTCNACRRFVETYGGLVTIDENGRTSPVAWPELDGFFAPVVDNLRRIVSKARVTGVFMSQSATWGTPVTGAWRHLSGTRPSDFVTASPLLTVGQRMAAKRADFQMLSRALADFGPDLITQAVALLGSDAMYRGEKVLGVAEWLDALHRARAGLRGPARENVVWRAIAAAPAGYPHVRSSMIGTLLEDLASGIPGDEVRRRFAAKMDPLQYRRPQAPPKSMNIEEAERIVQKMGIAPALRRRFATMDDIVTMWDRPVADAAPQPGGVFGHLRKPDAPSAATVSNAGTMTWSKFERDVLPHAERIEIDLPYRGAFIGLLTATDPEAPPILQWDREGSRNPVSWYVYSGGSTPAWWGLRTGWADVQAITRLPARWGDDAGLFERHGDGVIFVISGAHDQHVSGLSLFPETLRSELHPVRATIEAFSRAGKLDGDVTKQAAGYDLRKGQTWNVRVRVTRPGMVSTYTLDRWD